jgi:hypothetical protein
MQEGVLPVRYLGVPLISSRLTVADCQALIMKITSCIDSWISKMLTFVGRLQLISSILHSIQVYWSCIFILLKKIIKVIEQKFNRFLWNGHSSSYAKAKVAWTNLCYPKKEGSLELKDLEVWNRASMLRHVWNLFARSGSIWVAWIKENILKNKIFWNIGIPKEQLLVLEEVAEIV